MRLSKKIVVMLAVIALICGMVHAEINETGSAPLNSLKSFTLWTGAPVPDNIESIPFVPGVEHRTIHRAAEDGYKFLHGAAIINYKGTFYANWANSPTNENGRHETLQGRRSATSRQDKLRPFSLQLAL